jgi:hypothetical protein
VSGGLRKLHNGELYDMCPSPSIIRSKIMKSKRMRWTGHVARIWAIRNATRTWVVNPEGKRPLERLRRGWADNIKMDLREIRWGGMDWIDLAQDRDYWKAFVNTVMDLRVP